MGNPTKAENLKKRDRDGRDGRKKEAKPKRKKKRIKESSSSSSLSEKSQKTPLESPATSQAQIIAKVFSTFNRAEQGRFEAFRRSTFSSDAVAKYVAQCLIAESYPSDDGRQPILSHLTAPGQANEITIVVSTLAKLYAQRLVTSAREFADADQPVEPEHILKAFEERRAQGLDPGLFLQPQIPSTRSNNITLNNDSFQKRRLVALELQELYDKQQSSDDGGDKESEKEDSMNVDD